MRLKISHHNKEAQDKGIIPQSPVDRAKESLKGEVFKRISDSDVLSKVMDPEGTGDTIKEVTKEQWNRLKGMAKKYRNDPESLMQAATDLAEKGKGEQWGRNIGYGLGHVKSEWGQDDTEEGDTWGSVKGTLQKARNMANLGARGKQIGQGVDSILKDIGHLSPQERMARLAQKARRKMEEEWDGVREYIPYGRNKEDLPDSWTHKMARDQLGRVGFSPLAGNYLAGAADDFANASDEEAGDYGRNAYLLMKGFGRPKTFGQKMNPITRISEEAVNQMSRYPRGQAGLAWLGHQAIKQPTGRIKFLSNLVRPFATAKGAHWAAKLNPTAGAATAALSAAEQLGLDTDQYGKTLMGHIPGSGYTGLVDDDTPRPWEGRYWDRAGRGARRARQGAWRLYNNPSESVGHLADQFVDREKLSRGAGRLWNKPVQSFKYLTGL